MAFSSATSAAAARCAALSPAQKIGQTLMIGFEGVTVTPELRGMLTDHHIGGVILFGRNIEAPEQVAALTSELQALARANGLPGLLIAIDQEGGRVTRLTEQAGFSEFPSAMALAASGEIANAARAARLMAAELRAVGINTNFAPVLDVNNNPANPVIGTRSFGAEPATASAFGCAVIEALQGAGVLAVAKHFPGHGDTSIDSHVSLPSVAHARERLAAVELAPFRAAIKQQVAGIMSAHMLFPAFEPRDLPATLSSAVLSDLLRDELGYAGLVITDSLEMGALQAAGYPPPQAAVAALKAGADLLLFNAGFDDHRMAISLMQAELASGSLAQARLDQAVLRLLATKAAFDLLEPPAPPAVPAEVGSPATRAAAEDLAIQSITLLRNADGLLPLHARPLVLELPAAQGFGALLGTEALLLSNDPSSAEIEAVLAHLATDPRRPVIAPLAGLSFNPGQGQLIAALLGQAAHVVLVALRDPYDLLAFPAARTMLATYAAPQPTLRALATILQGKRLPSGRLPVTLPGLFAAGAGLQSFKDLHV